MKTHKNLFNRICTFDNLHQAYLGARKCKRYRQEILQFSWNLEENLLQIQDELKNQTYKHGQYIKFIIQDSKKREIKAAPFRDRVMHHALCNIIEPIFDHGFIYDSYACRKNKGTHRAIKRLEKFLRSVAERERERVDSRQQIYVLKCDISRYFASIDHKILLLIIKKKITDSKTLWLIKEIINSSFEQKPGRGIPIGNLTSQLFANIYLNALDQFVKHTLREKYYIRYMDDFLILDYNKKKLHLLKNQINQFLREKLKLEFHPQKANIFPANLGIDFLGYRIFGTHRLLRKSTVKRFVKRTRSYQKKLKENLMPEEKFNQSLQSWLAYAKFGNSWGLRRDLFEKLDL